MVQRDASTKDATVMPNELLQAIRNEARSHAIRIAALTDPEFMAGVKEGFEQAERGEVVDWEEAKRLLDLD